MSNNITKYQKNTIGLLSIGTFFEYFDFMLYVHMSTLLNDLFFPQTDPIVAKLLGVFALSVTFFFRPLGGVLIGKIGDVIGKKHTIIITTFIMGLSCFIMANLKTYVEIGILASFGVILCRILQSFSSLGEIVGAQLYVSEIFKRPHKFIYSGVIEICASIGSLVALIIALFSTYFALNWRLAFWFGVIIALVGLIARTKLRETPEFIDYKKRIRNRDKLNNQQVKSKDFSFLQKEKIDKKLALSYFVFSSVIPLSFYIAYIYMGDIMKIKLGMSFDSIVLQNLKVTVISIFITVMFIKFVKKVHPIKLTSYAVIVFMTFLPFILYLLSNNLNIYILTIIQLLILLPSMPMFGLEVSCFNYIPIHKRFSCFALLFGLSGALSFTIVSFFLVYMENYIGFYALWLVYFIILLSLNMSKNYLKKLEITRGAYYQYPNEKLPYIDTALEEGDFEYNDLGIEYEDFKNECKYSQYLLEKIKLIIQRENRDVNLKLIQKSMVFAKKWHGNAMRKSGEHPFYSHPFKVAEMVAERYLKTDVIVAAILHDVIEDSKCDLHLIEMKFNFRIAQIVDRLTNKRFKNGQYIKLTFEDTIKKLQLVEDNEALLIKKMDRMHNLETIRGLSPIKQKKMAEETNNYFIKFIAIIGDKLGISGQIYLENKMFQYCKDILLKKK
ncbi:MFS transporter [Candidatus Aquarickettsia rohweri]|uniref:MFS transporter n=1 Tax=Candidatus Aquarickettsia rohweri TaxID=2602574 RepID=A0A3R9XUB3_9RICK|nr:MFS transporter [Candidatus Aquarickettsia rohweri]RST71300.1 MFS transporter [Candidatus Aquarickettsia rohweri]